MKKNVFRKAILSLILALVVIFSYVCPAFAADNDPWVLHGSGAEYITHNGKKYVPIFDIKTSDYSSGYETDDEFYYYTAELKFDNATTESKYRYATVNIYRNSEYGYVETYMPGIGSVLYVAEEYMDKFNALQSSVVPNYILKTKYGIKMELNITEDYSLATIPTSLSKISSSYFEWVDLYSVDPDEGLSVLSGAVLRSKHSDETYLLYYREYDSSYFYADGSFARLDNGKLYRVHKLVDEELIEKIGKLIDARPEDELDWLAGTEPGKVAKVIAAIFFFGLLPLAIIVLCVIALIKSKKKFYRVPLITLIVGALALMISAAVLCF